MSWEGELSPSALSTATAITALAVHNGQASRERVAAGLEWLSATQNEDGGFGDTPRSKSNLSTSFLVRAAAAVCHADVEFPQLVTGTQAFIDAAGGPPAVLARYGNDRTFSVPILMMGALGGLCDWSAIPRLPFELAALPQRFYAAVRLPVVSYAMPALIAIGQLLHERNPSRIAPVRWLRSAARGHTLIKLSSLQPPNGGFLEATPLTSFVAMALIAAGQREHSVVERGVDFLVASQRPDGSWPIDTHLATWLTTLLVNAWGSEATERLPNPAGTLRWLLDQQYGEVHPFTGAAPGGWAWTPLPGGVPDADDTANAVRAIEALSKYDRNRSADAVRRGRRWLQQLTNRDGGTPTFCRGWGTLPFDSSTPELTSHRILARGFESRVDLAAALRYLDRTQQDDGTFLPLWFGNENAAHEQNPVYGTGRVLEGLGAIDRSELTAAIVAVIDRMQQSAVAALLSHQNDDGGFGGEVGTPSTIEETAVAVSGLLAAAGSQTDAMDAINRALDWLCDRLERGDHQTATPIGLYFANLWYHERLYPKLFALAALNQAIKTR